MTDELRGAVTGAAADEARDRAGRRRMAVFAAIAAMSAAGFIVLFFVVWGREGDLQAQVSDLASNAAAQHAAAQSLETQVSRMGGTPVVQPPPPLSPAAVTGAPGRGITGTAIVGGHFFVNYTDGLSEDKGQIVGKDGATGPAGPSGLPGRGITGSTITGGHLLISYTDNTTTDAGQVVGKDGRGVVTMGVNTDWHLVVSYTDGTTQDVGPLPPGPKGDPGQKGDKGDPGQPGPPPASWTWTDALGRHTCTRDPKSPDSAPTYTCTTASIVSTAARPTR